MLQAALKYVSRGYKIFPCTRRNDPYTPHGLNDASNDANQIRKWWTMWPDANIGLPMRINELLAIDLDRHEGKPDGVKSWNELCEKLGTPNKTDVMQKTGGATPGCHLVYQHPGNGYELKSKAGPGIDVRDRAYIVVAPSRQSAPGGSYEWFSGCSLLDVPPAQAPDVLLKHLLKTSDRSDLGGSPSDRVVRLLLRHGWQVDGQAGDDVRLRRPGKHGGKGATWNGTTFYVFTSNAEPFEADTGYTSSQVADMLEGPETEWFRGEVKRLMDEATYDVANRTTRLTQLAKLLVKAGPLLWSEVAQKLSAMSVCGKTAFVNEVKEQQQKQKRRRRDADHGERTRGVTTQEYRELFQMFGFKLRLNECNDDVELNGEYCNDVALARIGAKLADWGIRHPKRQINYRHLENAMIVAAAEDAYHPVKEYLESLEWDGDDHIAKLASYFDGEYFERWFRHWIVAAIAKVYTQFQSPMLVLCGGQGIGKSTFVKWLHPAMYAQERLNPNNKDCRIRLWTTWIWEVAELGATAKKTVQEALKWILTLSVLRERKSYGHRDTIKPVTASFIGTINPDAGFLYDRTGNRRYLVCEVNGINWAYAIEVDVHQLWAQAKAIHDAGDDWKLTKEDEVLRDEENMRYMGPSVIEEILTKYFRYDPNSNSGVWATSVLDVLAAEGYRAAYQSFALKEVTSVFQSWGSEKTDKTYKGRRGAAFPRIVQANRPIPHVEGVNEDGQDID